jgi:hypothetical protein
MTGPRLGRAAPWITRGDSGGRWLAHDLLRCVLLPRRHVDVEPACPERGPQDSRTTWINEQGADHWRPDARSAVEHQPADVVPQPLVVEHELANSLRELVALPPALASSCTLALSLRRGSTCGLDRIGGRAELVRRDVRDGRSLAGSVRRMPCCSSQIPGRAHGMAGRRASPGHGDLAARPGPSLLKCVSRPRVRTLRRLEEVEDMLRARCCPQGEEPVIRIGEDPATADRHETRIANFRKDHSQHPYCSHLPN